MDHLDAEKIALRMADCTKKLQDSAVDVGNAMVIREFASERRKNLVAQYCDALAPVSKAEMSARKNPEYLRKLDELMEESRAAEITISKNKANQASFEAARSMLSFNRESLRQLEG
jgi:predicted ArsR family transcriptional regulator